MVDKKLAGKRKGLYKTFDKIAGPYDFFKLQVKLANAIIESEQAVSTTTDKVVWQIHLDRLYAFGDALAWKVMDAFTIRQLSKNDAIRTALLHQKENFLELVESYRNKARNHFYLFSDLTRCIRVGDVIQAHAPDDVTIIESKGKLPETITAAKLLEGRNGRQFSTNFWLTRFLHTGFEQLYGSEKPTKAVELDIQHTHHFDCLPELLEECFSKGAAMKKVEAGLCYWAQHGEIEENSVVAEPFRNLHFSSPVLASTLRLIEVDTETAYHFPPLLFPISLKYRIALQEGEIDVISILDLAYLQELAKAKGFSFRYDLKDYCSLESEGISYDFHVRFLNDVLLNFQSAATTIDFLISFFNKMREVGSTLSEAELAYMRDRPPDRTSFEKYLEENYIGVLSQGNSIIRISKLNGEPFDQSPE